MNEQFTGYTNFLNKSVVLLFNNPTVLTQYADQYRAMGINIDLTTTPIWTLTAVEQQGFVAQLAQAKDLYFYFPWTAIGGIFYAPSIAQGLRKVS